MNATIASDAIEIYKLQAELQSERERREKAEADLKQSAIAMNEENDRHIERIVELENTLKYLDQRGGLGLDIHDRIRAALKKSDKPRRIAELEAERDRLKATIESYKQQAEQDGIICACCAACCKKEADLEQKLKAAQDALTSICDGDLSLGECELMARRTLRKITGSNS